jgi:polysaccharide export outer membrane protein
VTSRHASLVACVSALALSACALPADGPASASFTRSAVQYVASDTPNDVAAERFVLVDLTPRTAEISSAGRRSSLAGAFGRLAGGRDLVIGPGDLVRITVFEAGTGGLFNPQNTVLARGNFVDIPDQEVLQSGTLSVPYAGQVNVSGRRPVDVAEEIEGRLRQRAIEPQVVVTVVNRRSNLATVAGDANKPGRVALTPGQDRVLDAIAAAEGNKFPDYETLVRVTRGGRQTTARLSAVHSNPANNIPVGPGDVITLERDPRYFVVMGALGLPAQTQIARTPLQQTPGIARSALFSFDRDQMNLAEGLAKGGGLLPDRADPYTVVVYRRERPRVLHEIGADVRPFAGLGDIPTVYRLNVRDPSGFFVAQRFLLQNQDIVYVANAPVSEFLQISAIVRDISGTVLTVRDAGNR